ncbi:hypothetical protein CAPTEDRAFT_208802 [Capitella teleta]|uniref:MARVEL domain-containing protein n=1 Tax=Capitella teleta TaxID=283909 RepID=R7TSM2_CAPTE|nr:hypothetical protein CAPTEDRAFT_208802 [Capitella teleta]|eukprot:ELT96607.1 hypothetical protein CAPTEDRAFT_208802 [Capitella teleta]
MGDLNASSLWMKLGLFFTTTGWAMDLFALQSFGGSLSNTKVSWYQAVEAFEVIGYLCALVAVVLILCLVFLDEVQGNKIAHICYIVFSLVAGVFLIIGIAIYEAEATKTVYVGMLCVGGGLLDIAAGILAILDMVGIKK